MATTAREFLHEAAVDRALLERFLDPGAYNWARYDPELGYLLKDCAIRDGVDGAYSTYRYGPDGARLRIQYANRPCRINTYGDSFTQCHQVSDGETWQEVLAAHLGEPVRNYGVGGYGVYQAYRRLLREEATASAAEYILLNVWSGDHRRSIYAWRWLHLLRTRRSLAENPPSPEIASMFHCNPWVHLTLDLDTGQFLEQPNPYPTPDSLYALGDPEHVYRAMVGRLDVQALMATQGVVDVDLDLLRRAARVLGIDAELGSAEATAATANRLLTTCGLRASIAILDKLMAYARGAGKRLLILLSYSSQDVLAAMRGEARFDQLFLDALAARDLPTVDTLASHVWDYGRFRGTPEEYVQRYYIGHYNPTGNQFFAWAIKDRLVDWLTPKPPAYREGGPSRSDLAATLA